MPRQRHVAAERAATHLGPKTPFADTQTPRFPVPQVENSLSRCQPQQLTLHCVPLCRVALSNCSVNSHREVRRSSMPSASWLKAIQEPTGECVSSCDTVKFNSPMDSPPRLAEARRLLRRAGHERTRVARGQREGSVAYRRCLARALAGGCGRRPSAR